MITTLFCDIGNVLLYFSHQRALQQVAEICRIRSEDLWEHITEKQLDIHYEIGRITTQQLYKSIVSIAKTSPSYASLIDAWCDIFTPNETIVPVIKSLKAQGMRLILLSNIGESHYDFILRNYEIVQDFDYSILSYKVGIMKPHQGIFEAAIKAADDNPQQCFYIDDIPEYVAAARKFGIDAEQYVNTPTLKEHLLQRGIAN